MTEKDITMSDIVIEHKFKEVHAHAASLRIKKRIDDAFVLYSGFLDKHDIPDWKNYRIEFSFLVFDFEIKGEMSIVEISETERIVVIKGNCPNFMIKTVRTTIDDELKKLLTRHTPGQF